VLLNQAFQEVYKSMKRTFIWHDFFYLQKFQNEKENLGNIHKDSVLVFVICFFTQR